jgi:hypothetical protein
MVVSAEMKGTGWLYAACVTGMMVSSVGLFYASVDYAPLGLAALFFLVAAIALLVRLIGLRQKPWYY